MPTSSILLIVMGLLGFGLVQIYSSSYIYAFENFGDGLYFVKRQAVFALIAIAALVVGYKIKINHVVNYFWLFWILATLGILLTFVPGIGVKVGGAARWIQLPLGLRFEPSELLKISLPLLIATYLHNSEHFLSKIKLRYSIALILLPMTLLLFQPDFGSFAICSIVFVALLFTFGLSWKWILSGVLAMIPAFYFLVMSVPYRKARVVAFLDPWSDPDQKGFQVIQSMLSFRSGGFFGNGLGEGQGKLFFLPEAHTDFTLSVLGEELGFVGFSIVYILFFTLIIRMFQLAYKTDIVFFKAFLTGFAMLFSLSAFINAGVVLGLLPTKGLANPFLSYGGSSILCLCFMFGLVMNFEKEILSSSRSFLKNSVL